MCAMLFFSQARVFNNLGFIFKKIHTAVDKPAAQQDTVSHNISDRKDIWGVVEDCIYRAHVGRIIKQLADDVRVPHALAFGVLVEVHMIDEVQIRFWNIAIAKIFCKLDQLHFFWNQTAIFLNKEDKLSI